MTMIIGESTSSDADYKIKVKELCQTIIDDPALKEVFEGIDKFMENDEAKELFTKNAVHRGIITDETAIGFGTDCW